MSSMFDLGFWKMFVTDTSFFGQSWIIPLVFVAMIVIIISRNPRDWLTTSLPVYLGLIISFDFKVSPAMHFGLIMIFSIMFVIGTLTTEVVANVIKSGNAFIGDVTERTRKATKMKSKSAQTRAERTQNIMEDALAREQGKSFAKVKKLAEGLEVYNK